MSEFVTDEEIAKQKRAHEQAESRQFEVDLHRAEHAKRILEDELVVDAFRNLRDVYTMKMRTVPVDDVEVMARVMQIFRYRLEALDAFERELRHLIETGTMAETLRSEKNELEQRLAEEKVLYG